MVSVPHLHDRQSALNINLQNHPFARELSPSIHLFCNRPIPIATAKNLFAFQELARFSHSAKLLMAATQSGSPDHPPRQPAAGRVVADTLSASGREQSVSRCLTTVDLPAPEGPDRIISLPASQPRPHSTFWTSSRICSMIDFISTTRCAISASPAFDPIVYSPRGKIS